MMNPDSPQGEASKPLLKPPKVESNPVFMGLPRIRARLPSRNWLIFLSITGSFAGALFYDRREKKKVQQKWCNAVSHLAQQTLPTNEMPRKITVFLAAPPGDGLRPAREYFKEYIQPILVAAALDWDVVEGRREGEVRAGLSEKIRKLRKRNGEVQLDPEDQDIVDIIQLKNGVQKSGGQENDLVIGRHTWKEYVRGLHEGWLGPLDLPLDIAATPHQKQLLLDSSDMSTKTAPSTITNSSSHGDSTPSDPTRDNLITNHSAPVDSASSEIRPSISSQDSPSEGLPNPPPETSRKVIPTPPYIIPSEYPTSPLASTAPTSLPAATVLPFRHILGFLNTPIRTYYFLTKRRLADDVGKQVADMILSPNGRHWNSDSSFVSSINPDSQSNSMPPDTEAVVDIGKHWEVQDMYPEEEKQWHKIARAPNPAGQEGKERPWQEEMVIDERIGERMTTPETNLIAVERIQTTIEADTMGYGEEAKKNEIGWIRSTARWVGLSREDTRVKGWEHGLQGGEED